LLLKAAKNVSRVDNRQFLLHDQTKAMKRLSQFASYVLVLLMLAPSAFASMQCGRNLKEQSCPKSCCDGMDGMSMPMDHSAIETADSARIGQAPCCTVTQTDTLLPAAPTDNFAGSMDALVAILPVQLPVDLHPVEARLVEFPPGDTLQEPVLSHLCAFRI
jgi:hypothetical protein